jgi:hypothetical protein
VLRELDDRDRLVAGRVELAIRGLFRCDSRRFTATSREAFEIDGQQVFVG